MFWRKKVFPIRSPAHMSSSNRISNNSVSQTHFSLEVAPDQTGPASRTRAVAPRNTGALASLTPYRQVGEAQVQKDRSPAPLRQKRENAKVPGMPRPRTSTPDSASQASFEAPSDFTLGSRNFQITKGAIDHGTGPLPRHEGERLTSFPYVDPESGKGASVIGLSRPRDGKFEVFDISGATPSSLGLLDKTTDKDGATLVTDKVRLRGGAPGDDYYSQSPYPTSSPYQARYGESSSAAYAPQAEASSSQYVEPAATSQPSSYVSFDVPFKKQSKPADCWYASMQMVLSWKHGTTTKPAGESVRQHRSGFLGKKLAFGSRAGGRIMDDNGLVAVGDKLELGDANSLKTLLNRHGPIILCGKFDPLRQGHFVVLTGVDPESGQIAIQDPGWTGGIQWKSLDYLKRLARSPGSDNIDTYSAVALQPDT